jgi:hypothetical protein
VDYIHLGQDRDQWKVIKKTPMNFRKLMKDAQFLDKIDHCLLLETDSGEWDG